MGLILCHMIALFAGILLDLIIGDPHWMPHPVRLIGRLIGALEKRLLSENAPAAKKRRAGSCTCMIVILGTAACTFLILWLTYNVHPYAGIAVESILTCYLMAARSLATESLKVYKALETGSVDDARHAVSMIVGRDTNSLDKAGVTRAAVETVAENTSDGVIAPLVYTALGGPVAGFIYKAINTMDSMIGYKNERYEDFGRTAARMDDIVNYIPARLSAVLMILAAYIGGKEYSGKDAWRIFKRDRYNHKSPNSAQTESVFAGALKIRLAGPASYFGKTVEKPFIGDDIRPTEYRDIKKSIYLMYMTEFLLCVICAAAAVVIIAYT